MHTKLDECPQQRDLGAVRGAGQTTTQSKLTDKQAAHTIV